MALGLFKKVPPPQEEAPRTGKDVLRKAIKTRFQKKQNLQALIQELKLPANTISAFAEGKDVMNSDHLNILANWLFGNCTYDAEKDLLVSYAPPVETFAAIGYPPTTTSAYPPPWKPQGSFAPPVQQADFADKSKYVKPQGYA